jgi:hypothetical protein
MAAITFGMPDGQSRPLRENRSILSAFDILESIAVLTLPPPGEVGYNHVAQAPFSKEPVQRKTRRPIVS